MCPLKEEAEVRPPKLFSQPGFEYLCQKKKGILTAFTVVGKSGGASGGVVWFITAAEASECVYNSVFTCNRWRCADLVYWKST